MKQERDANNFKTILTNSATIKHQLTLEQNKSKALQHKETKGEQKAPAMAMKKVQGSASAPKATQTKKPMKTKQGKAPPKPTQTKQPTKKATQEAVTALQVQNQQPQAMYYSSFSALLLLLVSSRAPGPPTLDPLRKQMCTLQLFSSVSEPG